MSPDFKLPFYIKAAIFLIGMYAFISILYITQDIIVPVIYATIIAILLSPVVRFFVSKKINRVIAITGTLLLSIIMIAALFTLLSSQASLFSESFPKLVDKSSDLLKQSITEISSNYNISAQTVNNWITKTKDEVLNNSNSALADTLSTMGSALVVIILVPVYIFMILYYQPLLLEFIHKLFKTADHSQVSEILTSTKSIIQSYLRGLIIEATIVATLYASGLLIIGIEYAILLGIIGALLNIIPYLGGLIAVSLYMLIAFATKDSASYVLYVLALFAIVHFIDNSYIIPKVVASKVKINALVSITAVLSAGTLWGIPGMFLSIPITGIIKLIFDHIESLKPWGYLLGDTMPPVVKFKISFRKKRGAK